MEAVGSPEQPPEYISPAAAKARLRRVCEPNSKGEYKVPKDIVDQFKDKESRSNLEKMFEKCGNNPERFIAKVKRIYQNIDEFTCEANYEYMSEQDMIDAKWSERKRQGVKKHCEGKPGFTRRTQRSIYEKAFEEEASDTEVPRVGGRVGAIDQDCTMTNIDAGGECDEDRPGCDEDLDSSGGEDEQQQKILKQVNFPPEIERADLQPSSLVTKVSKAIQKRVARLAFHKERLSKVESSANDERDLYGKFFRWGMSMPVEIELVEHMDGNNVLPTHWVRPSSWVRELMRLHPETLTGGCRRPRDISLQLKSFWAMYRSFHPEHELFSSPNVGRLDKVLPLCLFGDEGRGPKRGEFLIWSIESPFGVKEAPSTTVCTCKDELRECGDFIGGPDHVPTTTATPEEFHRACMQATNNKGHSFLTRHVLFGLPSAKYKEVPAVEQKHIQLVVDDLVDLFNTGVNVGGVQWYACVIGNKGDFKHQAAVGNLERSYSSIGSTYGNYMCSLCLAGAPGIPFEQFEHEPRWASTLFQARPWSSRPYLTNVHFDESKPEHLLKLDAFHLWKVGLGRDLVGSAVVIFCRIGLFDSEGDALDIDSRLERAHSSFRLWSLTNHKSPGLRSFKKAFFSMKTFADSPWANCKGSDCVLLTQWLRWFVSLHLAVPTDVSREYERLLKLFKHTADQSLDVFKVLYGHALWMSRTCSKHLYARLFLLLRGYKLLAAEALAMNMAGWALKPKMHALAHLAHEVRHQLQKGNALILNPLCWGCEQNEDTMGHVSRLARKVSVRTITQRVLCRYFLKKRALLRRMRRNA
ncbi:unnamed protein product [Durusdinium trenchii]|uniref:Uncharacterized protein n=1 Tax=Durusdinium trenchii TaxID=1381693 RepID=A0ABP0L7R9_9DINO